MLHKKLILSLFIGLFTIAHSPLVALNGPGGNVSVNNGGTGGNNGNGCSIQ
ncbi:MAG: hypothetical protein WA432_04680 [Candidatus Babeliaceae bacterium]